MGHGDQRAVGGRVLHGDGVLFRPFLGMENRYGQGKGAAPTDHQAD